MGREPLQGITGTEERKVPVASLGIPRVETVIKHARDLSLALVVHYFTKTYNKVGAKLFSNFIAFTSSFLICILY